MYLQSYNIVVNPQIGKSHVNPDFLTISINLSQPQII